MGQNCFGEADGNSFSQEITHFIRSPRFHYHAHKNTQLGSNITHMNPIYILVFRFFKIRLNFVFCLWTGIILNNLTVPRIVKRLPTLYGTQGFITMLTRTQN